MCRQILKSINQRQQLKVTYFSLVNWNCGAFVRLINHDSDPQYNKCDNANTNANQDFYSLCHFTTFHSSHGGREIFV